MRAPSSKLMICIELERFFELPIIPAPKRNSKLHCEMWTNPFLPSAFWRAVPSALRFTRLRRVARLRSPGILCDRSERIDPWVSFYPPVVLSITFSSG